MKLLVLLAALLLQGTSPTGPATASIEGTVLDHEMKPVAGAEVRAFWDPSPRVYQPGEVPKAFSGSDGKFVISNMDAGGYRVSVRAAGFVTQGYGATRSGQTGSATGTMIVLKPGQIIRDVAFRLTRASTISGRVIANSGEPLTGLDVFALRIVYDSNGWRTLAAEASGAQTDDRGEYRIAGLGPGRYYIRAESSASILAAADRDRLGRASTSSGSYAPAFYPGEAEVAKASLVDVPEGSEVRPINLMLSRQQTYRVRGHVLDSAGAPLRASDGKPPLRPMIGLMPIHPDFISMIGTSISPYCGDDPKGCENPTGAFELTDVSPGIYWVNAQLSIPFTPEQQQLARTPGADTSSLPQPQTATAALRITNSDIDNVELRFYTNLTISGRVSIDDAPPSAIPGTGNIKLGFRQIVANSLGTVRAAVLDTQGQFATASVGPGEYRVDISGLPTDVFVSEARMGNTDVLRDYIQLPGPQSEPVNIKLSAKSGQVGGVVIDSKSKAISKATVVLVPKGVKDRPDLYKTALTDEAGRFSINGIAPGEYTAYSWELIADYSYFNPDFVRRYELLGKPVDVVEAAGEELQITQIPEN